MAIAFIWVFRCFLGIISRPLICVLLHLLLLTLAPFLFKLLYLFVVLGSLLWRLMAFNVIIFCRLMIPGLWCNVIHVYIYCNTSQKSILSTTSSISYRLLSCFIFFLLKYVIGIQKAITYIILTGYISRPNIPNVKEIIAATYHDM